MFEVIEIAGRKTIVHGRYTSITEAEQVCADLVRGAGKASLMIGYFIREAKRG